MEHLKESITRVIGIQVILIFLTCTNLIGMIFLIIGILSSYYPIHASYNILIVCIIMSHRTTPQIDVSHNSIYSICCDVTPVTPIILTIATRLHNILTGLLQIVKTVLKHLGRTALWQGLHLCIILYRVANVRHITECSHQIEVAQ